MDGAPGTRAEIRLREAGPADAPAIAQLHAESWRAHYRGAYSDAFLDGDVHADRLAVWSRELRRPGRRTILAERERPVGFASIVFDEDPRWGTLLDNLHVALEHKRQGIGRRLLVASACELVAHGGSAALYLWVLEQNRDAVAFYRACGGRRAGRATVTPPGGVPGRLDGAPVTLRMAWPDARLLLPRA